VHWLKRLVVPLSLLFMAGALVHQWGQIPQVPWDLDPVGMTLSFAALVVVFVLDAYGWHLVLRALGCRIRAADSVRIWMLSSLTRYLPGGVWPYAARASMLREAGIGISAATVSLYLETLLLTGSSFVAGLPALLASSRLPLPGWQGAAAALLVLLAATPWLLSLSRRSSGRLGRALAEVPLLRMRRLLALCLYYLAFWVVFAAVFGLFVRSLYPLSLVQAMQAGSALALSFCVGFVVFFIPGGIGVRESALYLLLLSVAPETVSLLVAVGSRLWIMAGELASLGLTLLATRGRGARGAQGQGETGVGR
jgi:hypothetical protein